VRLDEPIYEATVEGVRQELLCPDGGVYRYRGDTYYGGGEWILLTCSLAWHEARTGNLDGVAPLREWVRQTARPNGDLPEQVSNHAQEPGMIAPWVARWGPVATPLLWSHAMYLIMEDAALT
jgi:GH15 family glucan-1,4-alpha-glucosidase